MHEDYDTCICEHDYDAHEEGRQCTAETMERRARCSCPAFIDNGDGRVEIDEREALEDAQIARWEARREEW